MLKTDTDKNQTKLKTKKKKKKRFYVKSCNSITFTFLGSVRFSKILFLLLFRKECFKFIKTFIMLQIIFIYFLSILLFYTLFIKKKPIQIYKNTVFNIDNNKCFLHIRMLPDGSCNTENWLLYLNSFCYHKTTF